MMEKKKDASAFGPVRQFKDKTKAQKFWKTLPAPPQLLNYFYFYFT